MPAFECWCRRLTFAAAGRLYDYGFLDMAERWWIDLLDKLRPLLPGRHSDGRARAELLGGFPGRISKSDAQQRGRQATQGTDLYA